MARTIAITGKGGVGKTVTAALMIRHLKERVAGPILAIDADPDSNLGTLLNIPVGKTIGDLREETLAGIKTLPAGMDKAAYIQAGLHETIVETDKVDFLAMGRPEGPGCYCYVNNLLRQFADDLIPSYEWVVMDNEAGMEHLSRRTASHVDHLIVVINETPLAADCARRVGKLLMDLKNDVRRKHVLVNCVREDRVEAVRERVADLGMEYLGRIPPDPKLDEVIFSGGSVFDLNESSAVLSMSQTMARLGV